MRTAVISFVVGFAIVALGINLIPTCGDLDAVRAAENRFYEATAPRRATVSIGAPEANTAEPAPVIDALPAGVPQGSWMTNEAPDFSAGDRVVVGRFLPSQEVRMWHVKFYPGSTFAGMTCIEQTVTCDVDGAFRFEGVLAGRKLIVGATVENEDTFAIAPVAVDLKGRVNDVGALTIDRTHALDIIADPADPDVVIGMPVVATDDPNITIVLKVEDRIRLIGHPGVGRALISGQHADLDAVEYTDLSTATVVDLREEETRR